MSLHHICHLRIKEFSHFPWLVASQVGWQEHSQNVHFSQCLLFPLGQIAVAEARSSAAHTPSSALYICVSDMFAQSLLFRLA